MHVRVEGALLHRWRGGVWIEWQKALPPSPTDFSSFFPFILHYLLFLDSGGIYFPSLCWKENLLILSLTKLLKKREGLDRRDSYRTRRIFWQHLFWFIKRHTYVFYNSGIMWSSSTLLFIPRQCSVTLSGKPCDHATHLGSSFSSKPDYKFALSRPSRMRPKGGEQGRAAGGRARARRVLFIVFGGFLGKLCLPRTTAQKQQQKTQGPLCFSHFFSPSYIYSRNWYFSRPKN